MEGVPVLAVVGGLVAAGAGTAAAASAGGPHAGVGAALLAGLLLAVWVLRVVVGGLRRQLMAAAQQARLDPLTGFLDRTAVLEELQTRLVHRGVHEVVGVLSLDLDRLRAINHTMGHGAGDEVLEAVAGRLRLALRTGDVVGRIGGDEFVVVTSGLRTVADLDRLAGRILAQLDGPVVLRDGSRQMATASVGVAYALKGRYTALELLREADVALNLAKDGGGSRHVVFDAELRARASARVELERELRRAVEDGELVVQYQPIVTAADGTVEQVEALVRWRHPTRGLLPPHHFLSVASESGLILDVGQHVLGCACEQAARWSSELGRPVEVAVNLAERQLFDPALIPTVAGVLRTTGLPAAQLQLEISEELLGAQLERVVEVLGRLARIGVGLALDDFGTSRASLRQLESLGMIRTLKLDRAFVAGVAEDEVDRTLVSAVMALARSLGMVVVAEGVETPEQARALTRLGVHRLQGFYFQRPTEAEAITPLLSVGLPVPAPAGPADA